MIAAVLSTKYDWNLWVAMLVALVFALIVGALNGLVVVMTNLREQPAKDVTVANCGLPDGAWREQISGTDLQVKDGVIRADLGPCEVKIFVKQ